MHSHIIQSFSVILVKLHLRHQHVFFYRKKMHQDVWWFCWKLLLCHLQRVEYLTISFYTYWSKSQSKSNFKSKNEGAQCSAANLRKGCCYTHNENTTVQQTKPHLCTHLRNTSYCTNMCFSLRLSSWHSDSWGSAGKPWWAWRSPPTNTTAVPAGVSRL